VPLRLRHALLIIVAVVVTATCVRLGLWQLDRLQGRREINAMLDARGALPPVDVRAPSPDALLYRYVTATGTYDAASEIVLSGRSFQGVAGNHVLTPLVLDDTTAVLVDRGWVPLDIASPPITGAAAAPGGGVTVGGLALPADADSMAPSSPAPSVVTRIDVGVADLPYDLLPVYVLLTQQDPAQASGVPAPVPPPVPDEGPHLSYALQWFAFATIAIVGCGVLLRRDRRRPAE